VIRRPSTSPLFPTRRSSDLEVRQLADMVGIIAAGRLVREGSLDDILSGGAIVRIRIKPEEVARAVAILPGMLGAGQVSVQSAERSEEHTSELQSLAYLVCRL